MSLNFNASNNSYKNSFFIQKQNDKKENLIQTRDHRNQENEALPSLLKKVDQTFSEKSFKKIAAGKAKEVWSSPVISNHVFYTPVKGIFSSIINTKEIEIREEVQTAKAIQDKLRTKEKELSNSTVITVPLGENLTLELEEVPDHEKLRGEYTVKAEKATGDLEKKISQGEKMPFQQSSQIVGQFLNGMKDLHAADFVHGDLKPENILLYSNKTEKGEEVLKAKVSDFGKTRQIKRDEYVMHTGNPRFAAPEGKLSFQGEVYSSALVAIRVLEEEFLGKKGEPLIKERVEGASTRRGIEQFVVLREDCPQVDNNHLIGKVKVIDRALSRGPLPINIKAERAIHSYIDTLQKKLQDKYPNQSKAIQTQIKCLKEMTLADPSKRPSMQEAAERFAAANTQFRAA